MSDLGWREGFSQMGSYKIGNELRWVYALTGDQHDPAPGTVAAWIAAPTPYVAVKMVTNYDPAYVNRFPTRTAVFGGQVCSWPDIEADALIAAGIATAP